MFSAQRLLALYSAVLTAVLVWSVLTADKTPDVERFQEITVHRINVIEPDGTLRMVISDHDRLPGIIVRGQERPFDRPQAGMLFFNDEGSEIGGLIFGGHRTPDGAIADSGVSLSFDKYEANQIVSLYGVEDSRNQLAGLAVSDSPSGSEVNRRIWLGRGDAGAATLALMDARGNRRLVMEVAADGETRVSVLNADGDVVRDLVSSDDGP